MSLEVNYQSLSQNSQFQQFVDFAESAVMAGKQKAVARVDASELGGIVNRTIKPASGDWVGVGAGRLSCLKKANNITRDAFMRAVADMFGGEKHIPDSVKDAMKLQDYGKGKPLTARRILAVKTAIETCGYFEQKAFNESISKFQKEGTADAAAKLGYSRAEMPKLASAVNLYAQAMKCSEADALKEVTTPNSNANRLMSYGGRFMQSVDSFKNGLELIDSFSEWFDQVASTISEKLCGANRKYENGMSRTLLNASTSMFDKDQKLGLEKFAFEEIANNPAFDLSVRDGNAMFGMENNAATSCIGRNFCEGMTQTLVQIPPEKRTVFFKALTTLCPLYASNADQAAVPSSERREIMASRTSYVMARILKNFEKVAELADKGRLDAANLVKFCFPEIKRPGDDPIGAVVDLIDRWLTEMNGDYNWETDEKTESKYPEQNAGLMIDVMTSTGCTIEEADIAARGGAKPPQVQYYSPGSLGLDGLDGTTTKAREDLLADLVRPSDYTKAGDSGKGLLGDGCGFKFNLPGGKSLVANGSEQGKANAKAVLDELEALCGKTHPRQAASLLMMTSQSGLSQLRGGLATYGVGADEHAAMDFTFAKSEETGAIMIHYTSPKELPFKFDWTATIDGEGRVSTTPLRFADEATLKAEIAATTETVSNAREIKDVKPAEEKEKLVGTIMESVRHDRDLMALLRMYNGSVAMGVAFSAAKIRSPEGIQKKLGELKANIDELRAVSKGDRRAFEAGLKQIALLAGTAFAPGVISKMCKLSAEVDLDALNMKGLSNSSSPEAIFEMVCNVDRIVRKMFTETQVMASFGEDLDDINSSGAGERFGSTNMAMSFLLARCDDSTLNGLRAAFYSASTEKLSNVLMDLQEGRFPPGTKIEPGVQGAIMNVATMMSVSFINEIEGTVDDVLGIESPKPEVSTGKHDVSTRQTASRESANRIFELLEEHILSVNEYKQMVCSEQAAADSRPPQIEV